MKKVVILIISLVLITGCSKKQEKFSLDDKYYKNEIIEVNSKDIKKLEKSSYVVFTYNNFCNLKVPCNKIFEKGMKELDITLLSLPFEEMKKTFIYKTVEYAPSVVLINNGKVVAYLDANKEADLDKYQDTEKFKKWILKYIEK